MTVTELNHTDEKKKRDGAAARTIRSAVGDDL